MTGVDSRMQALRNRFVAAAPGEADALQQARFSADWDEARRIAHGLAGRSGMFGYHGLGETALALEESIDAATGDPEALLRKLVAELRALS